MTVLFISDLHLDGDRPEAIRWFADFLEREARHAQTLYILGDLFEAWIGDDDDDPAAAAVVSALRELTGSGVPCRFMRGNRDFLVGERFAEATGCTLLDDHEVIDLFGDRVLLMHGDQLCTDDVEYMGFRSMVRTPQWQQGFLSKPLEERRAIARRMRDASQSHTARKADELMDVNQAAVEETMRGFGVGLLLHGHTHRPAVHRFELDGEPAARIVLGAWHDEGSVVRWNQRGFELEFIPNPGQPAGSSGSSRTG